MDFLILIIIALALALDVFAISLAEGMEIRKLRLKKAINIAGIFALMDVIMVIIGWIIGLELEKIFSKQIMHLIVFLLLFMLGIQIIIESIKNKHKEAILSKNKILVADLALSLDAFIIGPSLFLLGFPITITAFVIGLTTFLVSLTGMIIGETFRLNFARKIKHFGIIVGFAIIVIAIIGLV